MNIFRKFWITWISIIQDLGFSNKTYNIFTSERESTSLKRKGHTLARPTSKQKSEIFSALLKKMKIGNWEIADTNKSYEGFLDSPWKQRPIEIIDTIVIGANNTDHWGIEEQFEFDISTNNDVTPGKSLDGITWHIFIDYNANMKKTSDFKNILWHTPFYNTKSIGIGLQYAITNNDSPPAKRIIAELERALVLLCLQFKLNPYKAI